MSWTCSCEEVFIGFTPRSSMLLWGEQMVFPLSNLNKNINLVIALKGLRGLLTSQFLRNNLILKVIHWQSSVYTCLSSFFGDKCHWSSNSIVFELSTLNLAQSTAPSFCTCVIGIDIVHRGIIQLVSLILVERTYWCQQFPPLYYFWLP